MSAVDDLMRPPMLPFAVFDEFGKGADDRVQDYAHAYAEAAIAVERERIVTLLGKRMERAASLARIMELEYAIAAIRKGD